MAKIQRVNLLHVRVAQHKVPNVDILFHAFLVHRLRNDGYAALRIPLERHLGCRLAVLCAKKASGFAANYWINRFTHIEITRLLRNKELSIAQISDQLNFSSPAYFTRYVKNAFGKSPQELRD